jgi:hypothetical protein
MFQGHSVAVAFAIGSSFEYHPRYDQVRAGTAARDWGDIRDPKLIGKVIEVLA